MVGSYPTDRSVRRIWGGAESSDIITITLQMIPGRIGCELAVLTILCVLMIFFFPLMQGPYSVVNGPATVFQAARAAARLRIVIVQGALNALGSFLISPLAILSWMLLSQAEFRSASLPEHSTILRC